MFCASVGEFKKRCIVIQNSSKNHVVVVKCYITVPIATGYKENKACHGDKKEVWQKFIAASQHLKNWRIFHTGDDKRST